MYNKRDVLKNKSFEFALDVIKLFKYLVESKKEYILSKQILRSGTSVGANIREAQNAQKECDETAYWLELLNQSNYIDKDQFQKLESSASSILKMIKSAILTTKQKMNKNIIPNS